MADERREPPRTEEGWFALHDMRSIDWDAWRDATDRDRQAAIEEGVEFLRAHEDLEDAEEGASALYTVVGHKADLMIVHLRPAMADLDRIERQFEQTTLAAYTDRATSYVSVTEASGYSERAREYFEGEVDEDSGLARYIQSRLHPSIPDSEHVCFYPMDKRRDPEYNWYDLPHEERAEHMQSHGEIGREYGGKVQQMITGSVGIDDWEWGVTLWADDMVDVKNLLYEMRFDPSTSKFAEFGPFYVGRRFPPEDLDALLAGEDVPTEPLGEESTAGTIDAELVDLGVSVDAPAGSSAVVVRSDADAKAVREEVDGLRGNFEHYDTHVLTEVHDTDAGTVVVSVWETESAADTAAGFLADLPGVTETTAGALGADGSDGDGAARSVEADDDEARSIREELADRDIYAGTPHGEDVYALVLYSEADPAELADEVEGLSDGFDRYDTHVKTALYEGTRTDRAAVVSIWETESAADTAADYLADLPGIVGRAGDRASGHAGEESGFGTMGMFYTVKPDHREEFVAKFGEVGSLLDDMEGHVETDLMVNRDDENDMFIASQWRSKDDAMSFFRSDAFSDTVQWGRDILADRPRHVFLA
ncbi:MAG: heme-binding protein [Haloarculaceae archaeon]